MLNLKKQNFAIFLLLWVFLSSCNGIMSGIYDEPEDETTDEIVFGFNGPADATRYILKLNATSFTQWIYVDLHDKTLTVKEIPDTLSLTGKWDGRTRWELDSVRGEKYIFMRDIKVAAQEDADKALRLLRENGEEAYPIGDIVKTEDKIVIV
jgi:hypothetical protein